ncbi:MAG: ABC transporter ATP-binding protein/permease [Oscillospiraceae bacterium]|jgi:ATP-binding cassette subfamily B protein|nr:ABC transporter ATP-binding protein/permease [Oscillospiraceae bacterium]
MKSNISNINKLKPRNYTLFDCIKLPFVYAQGQMFFLIILNISFALLPALTVISTAWFIDTVICVANGDLMHIQVILPFLALLGLYGYSRIMRHIKEYVEILVSNKMRLTMRLDIVEKRASLDFKHIEHEETNDLVYRVVENAEEKIMGGFHVLLELIELSISAALLLIIFATQVWWAAIVVVVASTPICLILIRMGKKLYDSERECSKSDRRANYLGGILSNRESVLERKIFEFTNKVGNKFIEQFEISRKIRLKTDRNNVVGAKVGGVFSLIVSLSVIATLIEPVLSGVITMGMFIALINSWRQLTQTLSWGISWHMGELTSTKEFLKELSVFTKLSETPGALNFPATPPVIFNNLEFCNVTFTYPGTTKVILDNLSFKLEKGKLYAFVGANGCGKTTIIKLITGLYSDFEGNIFINEKSIHTYSQSQLKSIFSTVHQDYARYEMSLKENILYGQAEELYTVSEISQAKLQYAISFTGLNDVIERLSSGLDTPLGKLFENGVDLSGGEWQRVAMARSMMSNAPVKILDEPTAALDPVSESRIYHEFEQLLTGKTALFISHRLGSTKLADEIFVVKNGQIVENGSHEELIAQNGLYSEMFESQRSWYQ